MKNLINLAKALSALNLSKEAATVAALARNNYSAIRSFAGSHLRRMETSERFEGLEGKLTDDMWVLWVAEDLADKLSLHSPAFIGASDRDPFMYSYGSYAFSASNDNGESVVLKIGPANEIGPYKKIIDIFGANPPSIIPKVFEAKTFDEIGYTPPEGISKPFSYIIMEELEKMPSNMSHLLQSFSSYGESLRLLLDNPGAMTTIIQKCCDLIRADLNNYYASHNPESSAEDNVVATNNLLGLFSEKIWNKIKTNNSINYSSKDIKKIAEDIFGPYINGENIKIIANEFSNNLLDILEKIPTAEDYSANTVLGKKIKTALDELRGLGINPNDLHSDNIMIRPDTGEIVISDLGHFTFAGPVSYGGEKTEKVHTDAVQKTEKVYR